MSDITPYDALGGEPTIRKLVTRFYALMDELPVARATRAIHPADLGGSAEKLFEYLTGWLGGPPLYPDKYGHPRLRQRHLHAPISTAEIDGWVACFRQAWAETVEDRRLDQLILPKVEGLAQHMRNRE